MGTKYQLISIFTLLTLFGSHCQMAPGKFSCLFVIAALATKGLHECTLGYQINGKYTAGAGSTKSDNPCYQPGGSWQYSMTTKLLLNEPISGGSDVGFLVSAEVKVDSVWRNTVKPTERLFKIELLSPQLFIQSRKAMSKTDFIVHTSRLEQLTNSPFLVHWSQGHVQSIYVPKEESLSLINLKKGIASLFQFQLLDGDTNETDSSGYCTVSYNSSGPKSFTKTKKQCQISEDTPYLLHPDDLFSVSLSSSREADYKMADDLSCISSVEAIESHKMVVNIRQEAGNRVNVVQKLTLTSTSTTTPLVGDKLDDIVQQISKGINVKFSHENLMTETETKMCQDSECPSFSKLVKENLEHLKSHNYGKVKGAHGFLKVLNAARDAKKDEISKVLKGKTFKNVLPAIYDILGTAQTIEAHEAVMKTLQFTNDDNLHSCERYLWALSMGSHPKREIIQDLLNRYIKTSDIGEKLQETLVLTIASMTDKYKRGPMNKGKYKIYNSVKEAIYNGIEKCDKKPCQYYYIRALKNLKSDETIQKLLNIALKSTDTKSSVDAMKAIKSFPSTSWNKNVIDAATKIFFQIPKKFDSSCRTLALDMILGTNPTEGLIRELLYYLLSNDKAFEIKKYVIQKMNMLTEKDCTFREKLENVIKEEPKINNYAVMSQKGMSSALARQFLHHPITNGTMFSSQEMSSGLVKRGVFDIVLESNDRSCEMFSLGLFSGGLSSMISSDDNDEPGDNEPATAGMEITLLGTQVRPFVFFTGQGELMGHVWAGTASESTTAFQINTLLHDHLQYIRLGPGFIAELNLKTALSFNLAGEIQISLWNRNSHSLVNENAGIIMNGLLRVDTSFVQSKIEFSMSAEPKLDLESDIEFASGVAVCLRLTQPSTTFKHNVFKIERIPGSKHKLRKSRYKNIEIPGRTYNLNHKNNEMCNALMQFR